MLLAKQGEYYKLHQLQFKENKVGEGFGLQQGQLAG